MRISDWSSDVCSSDLADHASGGCGVDDRYLRPALDHRKDLVLHAQERAGYIDIHAMPKPLERHLGKRQFGLRDRRIVERAAKTADRRQSLRDKGSDVRREGKG